MNKKPILRLDQDELKDLAIATLKSAKKLGYPLKKKKPVRL